NLNLTGPGCGRQTANSGRQPVAPHLSLSTFGLVRGQPQQLQTNTRARQLRNRTNNLRPGIRLRRTRLVTRVLPISANRRPPRINLGFLVMHRQRDTGNTLKARRVRIRDTLSRRNQLLLRGVIRFTRCRVREISNRNRRIRERKLTGNHLRVHVQRRKMRLRRRGLEMLHIRTSQRRQISLGHVKVVRDAANLTQTSRPRITRVREHRLIRTQQNKLRTRIQVHVTLKAHQLTNRGTLQTTHRTVNPRPASPPLQTRLIRQRLHRHPKRMRRNLSRPSRVLNSRDRLPRGVERQRNRLVIRPLMHPHKRVKAPQPVIPQTRRVLTRRVMQHPGRLTSLTLRRPSKRHSVNQLRHRSLISLSPEPVSNLKLPVTHTVQVAIRPRKASELTPRRQSIHALLRPTQNQTQLRIPARDNPIVRRTERVLKIIIRLHRPVKRRLIPNLLQHHPQTQVLIICQPRQVRKRGCRDSSLNTHALTATLRSLGARPLLVRRSRGARPLPAAPVLIFFFNDVPNAANATDSTGNMSAPGTAGSKPQPPNAPISRLAAFRTDSSRPAWPTAK